MPDLRTVRQTADLSQSEAARLLGVSPRTLQEWEHGRGSVARGLAARLLAILTRQERLPMLQATPIATPPPPRDRSQTPATGNGC
jgi:transcriptional regulator with XRE-family HTH domain